MISKFLKGAMVYVSSLLVLSSCERDLNLDVRNIDLKGNKLASTSGESSLTNEWKNNPKKLNVIYFVPNDNDSLPNFRSRISEILLRGQQLFAESMNYYGYGRKSYGLDLINDSLVNIIKIEGLYGKDSYPYNSSVAVPALTAEINAYFANNPSHKKSDHNLIILPSRSGNDLDPGGVPFYGSGRNAYALDYPAMDAKHLGASGTLGNLATTWIGGLLHELGHGLNLPHSNGTKSSNTLLGNSLMSYGNSHYGKRPVYLTAVCAAILNDNQVFATTDRTDWYQNFDFSLKNIQARYNNDNIIVSGKFTSNKAINTVKAYFDKAPFGTNLDYEAVTFATSVTGGDSFEFVIPLDEFQTTLTGEYQLRLRFEGVNGKMYQQAYEFSFNSGIPSLSHIYKREIYPNRSLWTITGSSTQLNSGLSNLLDGDYNTNWHTPWNPTVVNHPHNFTVDTKQIQPFNVLLVYNRTNTTGSLKDFTLSSSNDGMVWTSHGTLSMSQAKGYNYIYLPSTITARYVKIQTINSYNNMGYTHMGEFALDYIPNL